MTSDGTIYGRAVAEIYNKLSTMTEGVTALCAPSPTLFRDYSEHDVRGGRGGHQDV